MSWLSSIIGVGGDLAGAYFGANAAESAADRQVEGIDKGIAFSQEAIRQGRQDILSTSTPGLLDIAAGYQGGIDTLETAEQRQMNQLKGLSTIGSSVRKGLRDVEKEAITGAGYTEQGLRDEVNPALAALQNISAAGMSAQQREAALTGALGGDAQAKAFQDYNESAGQAYLRQQQEAALLRNQAALGGIGGGNVRTALQEQAMGRASTNLQQDISNLRDLATRGERYAGAGAEMQANLGANVADIRGNLANQRLGLSTEQVLQPANYNTQRLLGQADVIGGTGTNVANILTGGGQQLASYRSGIGTNLANLALGGMTSQVPLYGDVGAAQAAGTLGRASAIQQGLSNVGTTLGQLI